MVGGAGEARVGKAHGHSAALLVHSQGVGADPGHRYAVVDQERQRCPHALDLDLVFAGGREAAEVRDEHVLIGQRGRLVADVLSGRERALEHDRIRGHVDDAEGRGGDGHLAHVAQVVADHGLLRKAGDVALLVHVDPRAVAQGIRRDREALGCRPDLPVRIGDHDPLAVGHGARELQVEGVVDPKVVGLERRAEDAAPEAHGRGRDRRTADRHGELGGRRRGGLAARVHEVPAGGLRGIGRLRGDLSKLEKRRSEHPKRMVAHGGQDQVGVVHLVACKLAAASGRRVRRRDNRRSGRWGANGGPAGNDRDRGGGGRAYCVGGACRKREDRRLRVRPGGVGLGRDGKRR